jgi:mono/diheme cytochrome c family protein
MDAKILTLLLLLFSGCLISGGADQTSSKSVPVPYPEDAKSVSNPIPASEESLSIGKAKYKTFCSMCHGLNGRGGEEATKSFEIEPSSLVTKTVKKRTDGELFWATSNGVNDTKMLAWGDLLSDEEMWHLVNYMRVLQKES